MHLKTVQIVLIVLYFHFSFFFHVQLVGNFQTEAAQKKQESEAAVSKLSSVRKLIAKLLKSINEVRAAVRGGEAQHWVYKQ